MVVFAAELRLQRLPGRPPRRIFAEGEPFPPAVLCYRFKATRPLRPLDPAVTDNEKDWIIGKNAGAPAETPWQ